MSIFKDSLGARRQDIRMVLKKMTDITPFVITDKQERMNMVDELFPVSKYGEKISQNEIIAQIKTLAAQRFSVSNPRQKSELDDKIRFFKKVLES